LLGFVGVGLTFPSSHAELERIVDMLEALLEHAPEIKKTFISAFHLNTQHDVKISQWSSRIRFNVGDVNVLEKSLFCK